MFGYRLCADYKRCLFSTAHTADTTDAVIVEQCTARTAYGRQRNRTMEEQLVRGHTLIRLKDCERQYGRRPMPTQTNIGVTEIPGCMYDTDKGIVSP